MQDYSKKSDFSGSIAKTINAGGAGIVYAYDLTSSLIGAVYSTLKKTPELPKKAKGIVTGGIELISPGEIRKIDTEIKKYEDEIKLLYFEIGEECSKISDIANIDKVDPIKDLLAEVRQYEDKIHALENRIAEIEEKEKTEQLKKKEKKIKKALISSLSKIKDDKSVNLLIEFLEKKGVEVSEKTLDAIKGVTGVDIASNIHVAEKELSEAVEKLREWWEQEQARNAEVGEEMKEEAGAVKGKAAAEKTKEEPDAEFIPIQMPAKAAEEEMKEEAGALNITVMAEDIAEEKKEETGIVESEAIAEEIKGEQKLAQGLYKYYEHEPKEEIKEKVDTAEAEAAAEEMKEEAGTVEGEAAAEETKNPFDTAESEAAAEETKNPFDTAESEAEAAAEEIKEKARKKDKRKNSEE